MDSKSSDYSSNCSGPGGDFKLRDISDQIGVIESSKSSITTGMWTQLEAYSWTWGAHIWVISPKP